MCRLFQRVPHAGGAAGARNTRQNQNEAELGSQHVFFSRLSDEVLQSRFLDQIAFFPVISFKNENSLVFLDSLLEKSCVIPLDPLR